jgi:zinc protease
MRPGAAAVRTLLLVALLLGAGIEAAPGASIAHREVLPNGIVLLVAERPDVPIVAVRVYHRAGAVHDPPGQAGLANLTGAVLTRGTAARTAGDIDAAIEFVGGRLEAGAGRDGLTVSLSVLRRNLTLGLDLVRDVVLTPAFPDDEVKRKVAEIQAAIQRSEDNPGVVAARALARLMFPNHPYGLPVEGTRESVARLQRDNVVRFHQAHVRPDATVVAVVGAVSVDEARREILARFGAWPRPAQLPAAVPDASGQAPPRVEHVARPLTQATILLGRQSVNQRDPDYFPLAVASYIVGGGSASRLYVKVREEAGLAYAVGNYVTPGKHGASFAVSAQTRTAEVGAVVDIVKAELARLGRERVSDRELDLAKSYLIGSFPLRLDTSSKVADFLLGIEELGLGLDYADRYRERIARVTAEDVQRVAIRLLAPDAMSRVVVGAP